MSNDKLGDRLKPFEKETELYLDARSPIIARLDGRAFHTWTQGCCVRPFDTRLHTAMVATMRDLARHVGARYAYTESDEISLVMLCTGRSQPMFSARVQKMASLFAALASVRFVHHVKAAGIDATRDALFDCRVYNVPSRAVAKDVVFWRETDAINNSVVGFAQSHFTKDELHCVPQRDMRQMLSDKGVPWGALPVAQKFGTGIARRAVEAVFTAEELARCPPSHPAHGDPTASFTRQTWAEVELPLKWTAANPEAVIFEGANIDRLYFSPFGVSA
jgi:tRNA(His) guanylyltransferase